VASSIPTAETAKAIDGLKIAPFTVLAWLVMAFLRVVGLVVDAESGLAPYLLYLSQAALFTALGTTLYVSCRVLPLAFAGRNHLFICGALGLNAVALVLLSPARFVLSGIPAFHPFSLHMAGATLFVVALGRLADRYCLDFAISDLCPSPVARRVWLLLALVALVESLNPGTFYVGNARTGVVFKRGGSGMDGVSRFAFSAFVALGPGLAALYYRRLARIYHAVLKVSVRRLHLAEVGDLLRRDEGNRAALLPKHRQAARFPCVIKPAPGQSRPACRRAGHPPASLAGSRA
jgi:hypothetical protein